MSNRTTILHDLTLCSDHIPVVQDYQIVSSAGPATHYGVIASANVAAGSPFDVTVQALDANGNIATG